MKKPITRTPSAARCRALVTFFSVAIGLPNGPLLAVGADCGWSDRFGVPGLNAPATSLAPFMSAQGPQLMVNGGFSVAGSTFAVGTAIWDGTDWFSAAIPTDPWDGLIGSVQTVEHLGQTHVLAGVHCLDDPCTQGMASRWNGASWEPFAKPFDPGRGVPEFFCSHDDGSGQALYAAGRYFAHGGSVVARLDGEDWQPIGQFESYCVPFGSAGLASYDDGAGTKLYATACIGDFFNRVQVLAAWDGQQWTMTPLPQTSGPRSMAAINAGPLRGLYISGTFLIDGVYHDVIRCDGSAFTGLGASDTGVVYLTAMRFNGSEHLYAHGFFEQIGGILAPRIAHWNGEAWHADVPFQGASRDQSVSALAVLPGEAGDRLVAAGWFAQLDGVRADNIAIRDENGWRALSAPAQGIAGEVISAATTRGSSGRDALYCTGYFMAAGTAVGGSIAKFDGDQWSEVVPSGVEYPYAQLFLADTGTGEALHIVGPFPSPEPGSFDNVARLDTSGQWHRIQAPAGAYISIVAPNATGDLSDFMAIMLRPGAIPGDGWRNVASRYSGGAWFDLEDFEPLRRADGIIDAAWFHDPHLGGLFISGYRSQGVEYIPILVRWIGGVWSEVAMPPGWRADRLATVGPGPARGVYVSAYRDGGPSFAELFRFDGTSLVRLRCSNGIEVNGRDFAGSQLDFGDGAALYAITEFRVPHIEAPVGAVGRWDGSAWQLIAPATIWSPRGLAKLNEELFVYGYLAGTPETPSSGIGSLGCIIRPCPTDITADGGTGMDDLVRVLGMWSRLAIGEPEDIDRDGVVTLADLAELITHWDERCP